MVRRRVEPKPGTGFTPYHGQRKPRTTPVEQRKFIAWDGEGVNIRGPGKPQSYVLFGSSEGHIESQTGLSTFDCLDYILETGLAHPNAIHCGFAFSYDANMIIQSLSPVTLARLHRNGWARLKKRNGERYTVTFARGKYFRVSKLKAEFNSETNPTAKDTVTIFDIWGFFQSSFIKAYATWIGPVSNIIKTGKQARGAFSLDAYDEIREYWALEIQMLRELAEELRSRVYDADLRITSWHGPGALASYAMHQRHIKHHMAASSETIREAARYGYAGGRFELFKLGRYSAPVWGVDINSAYPYAIAQLPSLSSGTWEYVKAPDTVARFGIYHIRMRKGRGFMQSPGVVFHRDKSHNISFPWRTDGWYWSPEVYHARNAGAEVVEGWVFHGTDYPFAWVRDMYDQRRDWKRRGISAEKALKLCLNSIYGKLAQRIGWDPVKRRLPPFHQLEWAGWITSLTRARLYDVMHRVPFDKLIAVETDGLYMAMDPAELGITHSEELGGWELSHYDEVMYVQSGLAWLHDSKKQEWVDKRRGLDPCREGHTPEECDCPNVFSLNACRDYLRTLHAQPDRSHRWSAYSGSTTRFVGLGQALMSSVPTHNRHCVWETAKRDILPGIGKRIHVPFNCAACTAGHTAYDAPHDLVINSLAVLDPQSYPHSIPWEQELGHAAWREYEDADDTIMEW